MSRTELATLLAFWDEFFPAREPAFTRATNIRCDGVCWIDRYHGSFCVGAVAACSVHDGQAMEKAARVPVRRRQGRPNAVRHRCQSIVFAAASAPPTRTISL